MLPTHRPASCPITTPPPRSTSSCCRDGDTVMDTLCPPPPVRDPRGAQSCWRLTGTPHPPQLSRGGGKRRSPQPHMPCWGQTGANWSGRWDGVEETEQPHAGFRGGWKKRLLFQISPPRCVSCSPQLLESWRGGTSRSPAIHEVVAWPQPGLRRGAQPEPPAPLQGWEGGRSRVTPLRVPQAGLERLEAEPGGCRVPPSGSPWATGAGAPAAPRSLGNKPACA